MLLQQRFFKKCRQSHSSRVRSFEYNRPIWRFSDTVSLFIALIFGFAAAVGSLGVEFLFVQLRRRRVAVRSIDMDDGLMSECVRMLNMKPHCIPEVMQLLKDG